MNQRYRRHAADLSDLVRASQAMVRHGYDPTAFRIEVLEPKEGAAPWDRWGSEGLVEISSAAPSRHTKFYTPAAGRWLCDFERDLAGGGFAGHAA